ncbi:hypothetical protein Ancab_028313 [Ancistrocladus abbreviatus]
MADDLSYQQTDKAGLVAARLAKSLTPAEEPTKARGKAMHHVPRCSGSSLFATDPEVVQSRECAGGWGSPSIGQVAVPLYSQSDMGLLPLAHAFPATKRRERNGDQSLSIEGVVGHKTKKKHLSEILNLSPLLTQETLKNLKKGSRKLNKKEGKALLFNEDYAVAVSRESINDWQFLNRNHVICIGNELSSKAGPDLQPK